MSSALKLIAVALLTALLIGCEVKSQVVRMREDAQHNRLWLLDYEAVSVYDNTSGRLLRRIALPDWAAAGRQYSCPPDLVLDRSGTAFVSSNVLPVIWRIEGERFDVTRLELALDADQDKDFGFSSLAFARDGALVARSGMLNSLWRIDLRASSAARISSSSPSTRCSG
jgi:hypothetical protein